MSADVPVISIKQPLSGSCNIKYDSETALANIILVSLIAGADQKSPYPIRCSSTGIPYSLSTLL